MIKTEKLKTVFSVKIKQYCANSKSIITHVHQKGSILIGLIVTMVIMASLGAGMLYVTSTSTFQELFANNHARAYYAAESGARHALAVIRDAYANAISTTDLNTRLAAINNQTFNLANGDTFQISALNTLDVAGVATVSFNAIGTASSGFLQAKRQIGYNVTPANQSWGTTGGAPTGPIDFSAYPPEIALTGGGKVKVLDGGLGVDLNTAKGGSGKELTVITNTAWIYPGDYAVQVKTKSDGGGGTNLVWNMGLMFNAMANGTALPYGYGITFFYAWDKSELLFKTALPAVDHDKPIVILWQNVPGTGDGTGLNWIAYAPIDATVIVDGITPGTHSDWQLGASVLPTIFVKVIRNASPLSNDIRVYVGGPTLQGAADIIPTNFTNRLAYPKWTSMLNAKNEIKWPSFNSSTWPITNDYFTLINNSASMNTITPTASTAIAQWVQNTDTTISGTFSFIADTETTTGTSISNAVIRSNVLTGSYYSGIGLFTDPCSGNPKGDFYNLGIQAASTGGGGDGGGTIIQY